MGIFIIKRKANMEIKAVIDGTLINDSRAVKIIQSLKEEEKYVGLATGGDRPLLNHGTP